MNGDPGPESTVTRRSLARKLVIDLSVMTVIGVILALIGPFGSFEDPLAIRLMVWVGLAYAGYFIYSPVGWMVGRMSAALDLPQAPLWAAGTLIATVPMAVVVWSLNQLNSPSYRVPGAQEALIHYLYVLVIGAGITILFNIIQLPGQSGASMPANTPSGAPESKLATSPLLSAIPDHLGSDILALEMEDHYCRVHTALGSELVLMRLRDAVVQMDMIEGMQVHRSWWVARGAVEDIVRDGRNVRLKLARDIEAPVSRAKVSELKAAGWI